MPKKLPYLPLYTGDWRKDIRLSACSAATRGVWIDLLCAMHDDDRSGELRGTADYFAVLARCPAIDVATALTELQTTGTADVKRERNGTWIVCNRRMRREAEKRKRNADRQMRHRMSARDGPVTHPITPFSEDDIEDAFELFWKSFPSVRKHSQGVAREAYIRALGKASVETINGAAVEYANSEVARGKFCKMPSTWLNQECWNDDRNAWRDHDKDSTQNGYQSVTEAEFVEHYTMKRFKDGPHRHVSEKFWVFGTLRDGRKIECKEFKKRLNP